MIAILSQTWQTISHSKISRFPLFLRRGTQTIGMRDCLERAYIRGQFQLSPPPHKIPLQNLSSRRSKSTPNSNKQSGMRRTRGRGGGRGDGLRANIVIFDRSRNFSSSVLIKSICWRPEKYSLKMGLLKSTFLKRRGSLNYVKYRMFLLSASVY